MHPLLYIFPCSALFLEGLLLWRLSKHGLASRYPHLTVFVLFRFLGDLILFPINRYKPDWFAVAYWRLEAVALSLQFLVIWDFFCGVFPRRSALHDIAWKMLLIVELGILPAVLLLGWNQASSVHYLYLHLSPVVEQYLCLAQAILLLTPATIAWYYHVPLGRNLRGLCLGFGIYVLARSVNVASLQVFRGFVSYWRLLTPTTFIGMIAVWLWAFWQYAPSPEQASLGDDQYSQWKTEWQHLWSRTMALLRRGI
ncbi:MAG: hypothetical protein DMG48_02895 [Acidobacteria bacterium]|nr:MAG: hypothetical protein DMG48_02895 [Acidobacteriota bacterium]